MPTTRAMARKGSAASDDKENEIVLGLRKKPVRRAAAVAPAKATTGTSTSTSTSTSTITSTSTRARRPSTKATAVPPARIALPAPRAAPLPGQPTARGTNSPRSEGEMAHARRSTRNTARGRGRMDSLDGLDASGSEAGEPSQGAHARRAQASLLQAPTSAANSCAASRQHRENDSDRWPRGLSHHPRKSPSADSAANKLHGNPPAILDHTESSVINVSEDITSDSSEDELCSAKTPLRRNTNTGACPSHCSPTPVPAASTPVPKTPPPRMTVRADQGTCHTLAVPSHSPGTASPQRPMSTARGGNVQYVFHPLPKASRANDPMRGPYRWPVTPTEEELDPVDQVSTVAETRPPTSKRPSYTPSAVRASSQGERPQTRERLTQLFNSTFAAHADSDDSSASDDSDDEAEDSDDSGTTIVLPRFKSNQQDDSVANQDFDPAVDSDASDTDETEASDLSEVTELNQAVVLPRRISISSASSSEEEDDETEVLEDDETEVLEDDNVDDDGTLQHTPLLHSGLFHSTPSFYVSIPVARGLSPPSSPESEDDSIMEYSTLSNVQLRTGSASPARSATFATPEGQSKLSAMGLFKTPHMRSALDEFEQDGSVLSAQAEHFPIVVAPFGRATCIDPSVLSQQDPEPTSPRKDSVQPSSPELSSPVKPLPFLSSSTVAGQMAPLMASPARPPPRDASDRLSLLLNLDGLIESPDHESSSWIGDMEDTVVIRRHGLPTPEPSPQPSTVNDEDPFTDADERSCSLENSVIHNDVSQVQRWPTTPGKDLFEPSVVDPSVVEEESADTPHYAMPTIAFEARRRSMPAFVLQTPPTRTIPLRPAATERKAANGAPSPGAWLDMQKEQLPKSPRRTPSPQKAPSSLQRTASPQRASPSKKTPGKSTPVRRRPPPQSNAFTPHPTAPLRSVVAYVEIFARSGVDASANFVMALQRLGARTSKTLTQRVTHVVYKDGSPATLAKMRAWRRDGHDVPVVNSRWITDCDREGTRVDEDAEEYRVEVEGLGAVAASAVSARKRKSMEPVVLRDSAEKATGGRLSVASSCWGESPVKAMPRDAPPLDVDGDDESWLEATPAVSKILTVPDSMPVRRVRKLELSDGARRRLTAWDEQ